MECAGRPLLTGARYGLGHVLLFANNPIGRGETIGSYLPVLSALLNFDPLSAGQTTSDCK